MPKTWANQQFCKEEWRFLHSNVKDQPLVFGRVSICNFCDVQCKHLYRKDKLITALQLYESHGYWDTNLKVPFPGNHERRPNQLNQSPYMARYAKQRQLALACHASVKANPRLLFSRGPGISTLNHLSHSTVNTFHTSLNVLNVIHYEQSFHSVKHNLVAFFFSVANSNRDSGTNTHRRSKLMLAWCLTEVKFLFMAQSGWSMTV